MKLAAIYNAFDGIELLRGSMMCLKDHVDLFIIVWQEQSNYGEYFNPITHINLSGFNNVILHKYEISGGRFGGMFNERTKRNIGLSIAKLQGCTHFLHIDVDEYYEDFREAKQLYLQSECNGSVCKLYTYFKLPTLRFETPDDYYVPFIHELKNDSEAGREKRYPFYVDPTRRINEHNVCCLPDVYMHHFSWVRKDINMKIRNSSAKVNIEKSTLLQEYNSELTDGSFVPGYGKKLISVENKFNIHI